MSFTHQHFIKHGENPHGSLPKTTKTLLYFHGYTKFTMLAHLASPSSLVMPIW